ncbi:tape measure protein [Melissococcus plutonius]|uniref:tape measure protein n=1 Tax=Melissococcus plutonius TaxID=33970 RepID=UPI003C2B3282
MESYSVEAVLSAVDKNFTSAMKNAEQATNGLNDNTQKANTSILDIAKGVGVFKLVEVGVSAVKDSVGDAIKRFDTLNQYPKVLQSLGASAKDADSSMQILSDGIEGMPTSLDEVASTAQQMFLVFHDADKSAKSTIALNDALLASGSSGEKAARGTEQYLKMLRSGKVDMDVWYTLQDTMGLGLDKVAKSMLGARASTNDLYKALQSGKISVDQFNDEIIKLDKGTGGFADIAKKSSQGIGTSFKNMANAITKGVANIIKALDNFIKNAGINADGIAGIFDQVKVAINMAFDSIIKTIEIVTPAFATLFKAISDLEPIIKVMTPIIAGLAVALIATKVASSVSLIITELGNASSKAAIAVSMYIAAIKGGTTASQAYTLVQGATQGAIKLSGVLFGVLTGQIKLAELAELAMAKASAILEASMGPIGWIIAIVTAAGIALFSAYKNATKATKELKEQQDDFGKSLNESAQSYSKNQDKIQAQSSETKKLADEIIKLSSAEKQTTDSKADLQTRIDTLNEKVKGLGLAFGDEANGLNLSNTQLLKRLELQKQEEAGTAAQERLVELQQAKKEAEENLSNAIKENNKYNDGAIHLTKNRQNAEKAYTAAKQNLNKVNIQIGKAQKTMDEGLAASAEKLRLSHDQMVKSQKINYNELSDAQKKAFDEMKKQYESMRDTATNAFDQIDQKTAISADQMIANLNKNAEAVDKWGSNIQWLTEHHVNDGIIKQLEKMGPAGAAQAEELVKELASVGDDSKIKQLNDAYEGVGKTVTGTMAKTIGKGGKPIAEAMGKNIEQTNQTAKQTAETSGLNNLGTDITNNVTQGIDKGTEKTKKAAIDGVDKTTKAAKKKTEEFDLGKWFDGIWVGIKEGAANATKGVASAWDHIKDFFSNTWESVKQTTTDIWDNITEIVQTAWNNITQKIMEILQPFIDKFNEVWDGLKEWLSRLWSDIGEIAEGAWDGIKNIILTPVLLLADIVTGDFSDMGSQLSQIWDNIKEAGNQIWSGIKSLIGDIVNTIVDNAKSLWQDFNNWISDLWQGIKNMASDLWDGIKSTITNLINRTVGEAKNIWNGLNKWMSDLWDGIKQNASNLWNGIKRSVLNIINGIVEDAEQAWANLKKGVSNAIDRVKSTFDSLAEIDLLEVGKNIIQGLINGIGSMVGAVTSKVEEIAGGIKDKITSVLGIHSPSRWMRDMIGKNMMLGWSIGLDKNQKYVQQSISNITNDTQNGLLAIDPTMDINANIAKVNSSIDTQVQHNVSIGGNKKPAVFNIQLGNQQFKSFVSDISDAMGAETTINMQF